MSKTSLRSVARGGGFFQCFVSTSWLKVEWVSSEAHDMAFSSGIGLMMESAGPLMPSLTMHKLSLASFRDFRSDCEISCAAHRDLSFPSAGTNHRRR